MDSEIVLLSVVPFLSVTAVAALPANCTQSGISVSCTYYADSATSNNPNCYNGNTAAYLASLDTSAPAAGSASSGFCILYTEPVIQLTSIDVNVYLGFNPIQDAYDYADLFAAPSVNAINSAPADYLIGSGQLSSDLSQGGSCASPSAFVCQALSPYTNYAVNPGNILDFVGNSESGSVVRTGSTAGGQDTPISFTITGNEIGVTAVTTTLTETQTDTASVTTTATAPAHLNCTHEYDSLHWSL